MTDDPTKNMYTNNGELLGFYEKKNEPLDPYHQELSDEWNSTFPSGNQAKEAGDERYKFDENISGAAAIINYGPINAAAREMGVTAVIEAIYNFVPDGSDTPIMEQLLINCGIDTPKEVKDLKEEQRASIIDESESRTNVNIPSTIHHPSEQGILKAILEFKELVSEIKTSPDFKELREGAMTAQRNFWDFLVMNLPMKDRSLTTVFKKLEEYKYSNHYQKTSNPNSLFGAPKTKEDENEKTEEDNPLEETTEEKTEEEPKEKESFEVNPEEEKTEEGKNKNEEEEKAKKKIEEDFRNSLPAEDQQELAS